MLLQYQQTTRRLLNDANFVRFIEADLTDWINVGRGQIAAEGECVREEASLALAAATADYNFSALATTATNVNTVIAVRSARIGTNFVGIRTYEWYARYHRGDATQARPKELAQRGQGTAGTLHFYPVPDQVYTASLDTVYLPIDLVTDSTSEALPRLWTDAVPFYAAWMALLTAGQSQEADAMFQRYLVMMRRARQGATPSELPDNLPGGAGTQAAAMHQSLETITQQGQGGAQRPC